MSDELQKIKDQIVNCTENYNDQQYYKQQADKAYQAGFSDATKGFKEILFQQESEIEQLKTQAKLLKQDVAELFTSLSKHEEDLLNE